MERESAERIMQSIMFIEKNLNDINNEICFMPDGDEKEVFAKGLGKVMFEISFEFIFKLAKQFPDLDPDKDRDVTKPPPACDCRQSKASHGSSGHPEPDPAAPGRKPAT